MKKIFSISILAVFILLEVYFFLKPQNDIVTQISAAVEETEPYTTSTSDTPTQEEIILYEDTEEMEFDTPQIPDGYRLDKPEISLEIENPVDNGKVSSLYGMRENPVTGKYKFHSGYDIAASTGENVKSAFNGVIKKTANDKNGYGNYIVVDHGNGIQTLYAHLSEILCQEGEKAERGKVIGKVGATGNTTGAHLHFELIIGGEKYDPEWILGGVYN